MGVLVFFHNVTGKSIWNLQLSKQCSVWHMTSVRYILFKSEYELCLFTSRIWRKAHEACFLYQRYTVMGCYLPNSLGALENVWEWILSRILEKILQNSFLWENIEIQYSFLPLNILQDIFTSFMIRGMRTFHLISDIHYWWWACLDNWNLNGRNDSFP